MCVIKYGNIVDESYSKWISLFDLVNEARNEFLSAEAGKIAKVHGDGNGDGTKSAIVSVEKKQRESLSKTTCILLY